MQTPATPVIKLSKYLQFIDWLGCGASFGYAAYSHSWLWALGGCLSLIVAVFKPADRVAAALKKHLLKKKEKQDDLGKIAKADEFYAQFAPNEPNPSIPAAPAVVGFSGSLTVGRQVLSSSRHNQLTPSSLQSNLASTPAHPWV